MEFNKTRFIYGVRVVMPSRLIAIPCSIVGVLTLGYYVPSWDFRFMAWSCKRDRLRKRGKK